VLHDDSLQTPFEHEPAPFWNEQMLPTAPLRAGEKEQGQELLLLDSDSREEATYQLSESDVRSTAEHEVDEPRRPKSELVVVIL